MRRGGGEYPKERSPASVEMVRISYGGRITFTNVCVLQIGKKKTVLQSNMFLFILSGFVDM